MSSAGAVVERVGAIVVEVDVVDVDVVDVDVVVVAADNVSDTANHLYVPPHGSPKTPLSAEIVTVD